jgi:Flp pilus assembly protein TadB
MSIDVIVLAALGTGAGLGILLLLGELTGRPIAIRRPPVRVPARVLAAFAVGLLVLALTRWIAVAVGIAILTAHAPRLFGGGRAERERMARLDALATWSESLRDLVATGSALPEAVGRSIPAAPAELARPLARLSERLELREPLDTALLALADDLNDIAGDVLVAALALNARVQGRQLVTVLSGLATSLRTEVDLRRRVDAERRATRRAVRIVSGVTVFMALGLATLNPVFLAPYRTPGGQVALAVVVAVYACGLVWLQRLAVAPPPRRFLSGGAR